MSQQEITATVAELQELRRMQEDLEAEIIRRKPLPFFRFDSGHQFLAGHIIHFPLPSADPSILMNTNGATSRSRRLMGIL